MDAVSSGTLQSPSTFSESSKTGSSKSGTRDGGKDREEDLTKDNGMTLRDNLGTWKNLFYD
jgi:hypothetical protein